MKPGMLPVIKAYIKQEMKRDILTETKSFQYSEDSTSVRGSNEAEGREIKTFNKETY